MNPSRAFALPLIVLAVSVSIAASAETPVAALPGYVDGAVFRGFVDDSKDVVEINLDGAILRALANSGGGDHDAAPAKNLFAKMKAIHAVIGTVKGRPEAALALVQATDQKLAANGWQRVTRISDATSKLSVLTHTVADKVDGLVVLIFDTGDNQLVFANLVGEIDVTQLGEIGKKLSVPGLDQVPSGH
jgi:hypothetical protein